MMEPFSISIIIPCYNCGTLVGETLKTLENQSFTDFEVICVNDGSKDDTLEVLTKWQNESSLNINVLDQENSGVSVTRNRGMEAAKGKYILFLDADDMYHPDFIRLLVDAIESSNADVSYCRLSRDYDTVFNKGSLNLQYEIKKQPEAMYDLLYKMGSFGFYCYLYRRELLEKENIRFVPDSKFGEDREIIWKYMCHCNTAAFVDEVLYWYRPNMNSATQGKASWRRTDSLAAVKRVEGYMKEKNIAFLESYRDYMYARDMWAVAKNFAARRDKELFNRLRKEYDVKTCMKRTAMDKKRLVAIASKLYLIHPMLFFYTVAFSKYS